jgi:hypothetical protein
LVQKIRCQGNPAIILIIILIIIIIIIYKIKKETKTRTEQNKRRPLRRRKHTHCAVRPILAEIFDEFAKKSRSVLVCVSDAGSSFGFQRAAIAAKSEKRILRERERERERALRSL